MKAKALENYISVIRTMVDPEWPFNLWAEVDCEEDYQTFKTLPVAIECNGRTLGKMSFNSDTHRAYYSTSATLAKMVG
jgi:hypothetical protein